MKSVCINFPDSENDDGLDLVWEVLGDLDIAVASLTRLTHAQGDMLMAGLAELQAAQAATLARVAEVDAEVRALLAREPGTVDLSDEVAAEEAIKAALDAIPSSAPVVV